MRARVISGVVTAMVATCLASPSLARGSTALLQPGTVGLVGSLELAYTAAPGEQNRVFVRPPTQADVGWVVSDAGAVIEPGEGCESLDSHSVRCGLLATANPPQLALYAHVRLGDLDDEVRLRPDAPFAGGRALVADGGPGNDRLVGSSDSDTLNGGPGRDELRGEGGSDQLLDLDTAERDTLDGGVGDDTVSYRGRSAAITVDLSAGRGGEAGERDTVSHVESVIGGRGDDLLVGTAEDNFLDGGGGANRLSGLAGNDSFENANGPIACGTGTDSIRDPTGSDFLEPDCDLVSFGDDVELWAQPVVRRGRLSYRARCPASEEGPEFSRCSGTLVVRHLRGQQRVLARKRFPERRWEGRRIRTQLTPAGRRLAARSRGVRVSVSIVGRRWVGVRWTTRLISRRESRASARSAPAGAA